MNEPTWQPNNSEPTKKQTHKNPRIAIPIYIILILNMAIIFLIAFLLYFGSGSMNIFIIITIIIGLVNILAIYSIKKKKTWAFVITLFTIVIGIIIGMAAPLPGLLLTALNIILLILLLFYKNKIKSQNNNT